MDSLNIPIRIGFRQFKCNHTANDDLGMEIGHGDDPEGTINRTFSNEKEEVLDFNGLDELVHFLSYTSWVGVARGRIDGGIDFHYYWYGHSYSEISLYSRLTCENPEVLDALWSIFQKNQYDPQADADDWLDTERDRYAPEL